MSLVVVRIGPGDRTPGVSEVALALANADAVLGLSRLLDELSPCIGPIADRLVIDGAPRNGADALIDDAMRRGLDDVVVIEEGEPIALRQADRSVIGVDREGVDQLVERCRTGALAGLDVAVTSPQPSARALGDRLSAMGARPVLVPATQIELVDVSDELRAALAEEPFDWIVVTSQNAVRALGADRDVLESLANAQLACVGQATARAATRFGLEPDLVPSSASAESLVAQFEPADDEPSVLFLAGERAGQTIEAGLGRLGYRVRRIDVYRSVPAVVSDRKARRIASADAVVFSSASAVDETLARIGVGALTRAVVSIGPSTSAAIDRWGVMGALEAKTPDLDAIVDALVERLGRTEGPAESQALGI